MATAETPVLQPKSKPLSRFNLPKISLLPQKPLNEIIMDKLKILNLPEIPETIITDLRDLLQSLKYMRDEDVVEIYKEIKDEQIAEPRIQFSIVRSPISERLLAEVTSIVWNNEQLLTEKIILYKSTGESRQTGLGGIWMPYLGERYDRSVAKLEDKYISIIEDIVIRYRPEELSEQNKLLLVDIIQNIALYKKYKRFIFKNYAVASYLLSLYEEPYYMSESEEHKRKYIRSYTDEEKQNAKKNLSTKIFKIQDSQSKDSQSKDSQSKDSHFIDYIPVSKEIIDEIINPIQKGGTNKYYIKYLKYKNKYMKLKNTN
jgi:hypothetical protein